MLNLIAEFYWMALQVFVIQGVAVLSEQDKDCQSWLVCLQIFWRRCLSELGTYKIPLKLLCIQTDICITVYIYMYILGLPMTHVLVDDRLGP